eukprot:COSAG01_NODE_1773_length_9262_cov_268.767216_1_plen_95_part_00
MKSTRPSQPSSAIAPAAMAAHTPEYNTAVRYNIGRGTVLVHVQYRYEYARTVLLVQQDVGCRMYRVFTMYWTALQWYAHIQILRRRYIGSTPPK